MIQTYRDFVSAAFQNGPNHTDVYGYYYVHTDAKGHPLCCIEMTRCDVTGEWLCGTDEGIDYATDLIETARKHGGYVCDSCDGTGDHGIEEESGCLYTCYACCGTGRISQFFGGPFPQ